MQTIGLIGALQQGPPDRTPGMMGLYLLIAALLIALIVIVLLFLFFPRLEKVKVTEKLQPAAGRREPETGVTEASAQSEKALESETVQGQPIDTTLRLLEPDERRVVEALMKAGGTMLQKDIAQELGLSRVKTHRLLVRLLRRGVVNAEKYYNTNRVQLADWVREASKQ
ncbi:MAG: helix-turn-helix domain-containing protein [Candidatus Bathyarchaeia archaeon]